jgi:hypothetical protein
MSLSGWASQRPSAAQSSSATASTKILAEGGNTQRQPHQALLKPTAAPPELHNCPFGRGSGQNTEHRNSAHIGGYRLSSAGCLRLSSVTGLTVLEGRDQLTCAHVLRLTAAQADTSLMPNSAASCR